MTGQGGTVLKYKRGDLDQVSGKFFTGRVVWCWDRLNRGAADAPSPERSLRIHLGIEAARRGKSFIEDMGWLSRSIDKTD